MSNLDIRIWEVGAGLCIRIRTPSGQNHMIDAGCSPDFSPAEHIFQYHWHENDVLNYLIISHQDKDHFQDLPNVLKYLKRPKTYLRNKSVPNDEKYGSLEHEYQQALKSLDDDFTEATKFENSPCNPLINGGVRIQHQCLDWSDAKTINNSSIVVAYEYMNVVTIFPGDIEDTGWQKLLEKNPALFGDLLKSAKSVILVAPHHGRESGYSQSMIDYFTPDLIVISDGFGDGATDPRFRTCASGLEIKGTETKFITTKTKGRKRITISSSGHLNIHEED